MKLKVVASSLWARFRFAAQISAKSMPPQITNFEENTAVSLLKQNKDTIFFVTALNGLR